jgi:hypothetical protein
MPCSPQPAVGPESLPFRGAWRRRWRMSLLVAVGCLAATTPAQAVPITVPTGLAPGAEYRLAFLTTAARDATSGDIAVYNAFVTTDALLEPALLALGTTWRAIGSTVAIDARTNTATDPTPPGPTGVPIYLLNDTLLAADYDDLWDGNIANGLRIRRDGTAESSLVWTGTQPTGLTETTANLGRSLVQTGVSQFSSELWISEVPTSFLLSFPLYGMSAVLTVPDVLPVPIPEPGTFMLLASALGGLLVCSWRRTRRRARRVRVATPELH